MFITTVMAFRNFFSVYQKHTYYKTASLMKGLGHLATADQIIPLIDEKGNAEVFNVTGLTFTFVSEHFIRNRCEIKGVI